MANESTELMEFPPELEAVLDNLPQAFYDQDENVRKIHLSMIQTNGNRTIAAQVLEMDVPTLSAKIKRVKFLREAWGEELGLTHKMPTLPAVAESPDERALKYQQSLEMIGLDEGQAELGSKLYKLQRGHGRDAIAMLGGGMQQQAMQLLAMIKRLSTNPYPDEFTADGILLKSGARETDLMILRANAEYGRRATELAQITLINEKIQKIHEDQKQPIGNQPPGKQKPGFQPLRAGPVNVLAQPGSTVVLGGNNGQTKAKTEAASED